MYKNACVKQLHTLSSKRSVSSIFYSRQNGWLTYAAKVCHWVNRFWFAGRFSGVMKYFSIFDCRFCHRSRKVSPMMQVVRIMTMKHRNSKFVTSVWMGWTASHVLVLTKTEKKFSNICTHQSYDRNQTCGCSMRMFTFKAKYIDSNIANMKINYVKLDISKKIVINWFLWVLTPQTWYLLIYIQNIISSYELREIS
jgi:hypothetical protein